jgi:HTH-type transcriptional regulator / antitoxin HigA
MSASDCSVEVSRCHTSCLVAPINYLFRIVFIRFVGTHEEYDDIGRGDDLMEISVRPIRTEADYDATLADVDALMDAMPGTAEGDRLDVLVTLIEAYEAKHWAMDAPHPLDAIRIRMEQMSLRNRDLEPMIGSRGRVSEVLSGKRALTLPMIRRLSKGLDLPPEILIQEIPVATRRRHPGGSSKAA